MHTTGCVSCKIGGIDSTLGIDTSDEIDNSDSRAYESVLESGVEEGMESYSDADSGVGIITPLNLTPQSHAASANLKSMTQSECIYVTKPLNIKSNLTSLASNKIFLEAESLRPHLRAFNGDPSKLGLIRAY